MELAIRFVAGGLVVSLLAVLGDIFKPKSFAGLFGAAPSVAVATLGLAVLSHGTSYAALEGRSMAVGAVAFLMYALACMWIMARHPHRAVYVCTAALLVWFAGAAAGLMVLR